MPHRSGRHFLQIPGSHECAGPVLRAMDHPTIDHRGPDFGRLGLEVLQGMKGVFKTESEVFILPVFRHRCLGGCVGQHAVAG